MCGCTVLTILEKLSLLCCFLGGGKDTLKTGCESSLSDVSLSDKSCR